MIRITERWSLDETGCCAKNGQIRIKLRINISDLGQTHAGVERAGDVEPEQRPVLLRHPLSSTRQKQRLCTAGIFGTFLYFLELLYSSTASGMIFCPMTESPIIRVFVTI